MEHRWGQRLEVKRLVRLTLRSGLCGWGHIRNISVSGAWITTRMKARLMAYVEVGFTALTGRRRTVAKVEGQIVRISRDGFGIEWCELAHPAVLEMLQVHPYRPEHHARRDSPR